MTLEQKVHDFIRSPFPLWDLELTDMLVQSKLTVLNSQGLTKPSDYSTLGALRKDFDCNQTDRDLFYGEDVEKGIYLEHLHSELTGFYDEHGLLPCSKAESESTDVTSKLCRAFRVFESVEQHLSQSLQRLIRSIHMLRQDDPEIDISYSHPNIPFSIFLTLCPENSPASVFRVAESIIHEAMHLKLTLIEDCCPLIKIDTKEHYYSPWRAELRPVRGVLHGLFVFAAVYCFYNLFDNKSNGGDYIKRRRTEIFKEVYSIEPFPTCRGLTRAGRVLAENLLSILKH